MRGTFPGARFVSVGLSSVPGEVGMQLPALCCCGSVLFSLAVGLAWVSKEERYFHGAPAVLRTCPPMLSGVVQGAAKAGWGHV